jgi:hypothetical protein
MNQFSETRSIAKATGKRTLARLEYRKKGKGSKGRNKHVRSAENDGVDATTKAKAWHEFALCKTYLLKHR